MKIPILQLQDVSLSWEGKVVLDHLSWTLYPGENWVLGGKSGSGKSTLSRVIAGEPSHYSGRIVANFDQDNPFPALVWYVPNWYTFTNLEGERNFYYQQRYNRIQHPHTLSVLAELRRFGEKYSLDLRDVEPILERFGFGEIKRTQLIELSSGEHKKLQLIQAFWLCPQILIFDEPFTGLDKLSRQTLLELMEETARKGSTLILIANEQQLPSCFNRFAEIEDGKIREVRMLSGFDKGVLRERKEVPWSLQKEPEPLFPVMAELRNVSVRYGEKMVLHNINWTVSAGEKWLLQGPNGSGKSTLLSLLTGDHPQAYATGISLFGQKRGSGESIWDIKARIGHISPELHWYFNKKATVRQTVASGLHDTMGWFLKTGYEEERKIGALLEFFDLVDVGHALLNTLPLGRQRLALLARTIIKNPHLLILDEPCQGLDSIQTAHFNKVVDELCAFGKTLIYVGHDESQVPSCIDSRIVLDKGWAQSVCYKKL